MYWYLLAFGVLLGSIAQIPLKASSGKRVVSPLRYFLNRNTLLGYSMMLVSAGLGFVSIRHLELKYMPIVESMGYVYILIIGSLVFKERITVRGFLACVLILSGVIVFSL